MPDILMNCQERQTLCSSHLSQKKRALDMRWLIGRSADLALTILVSNKREWNNYFINFH